MKLTATVTPWSSIVGQSIALEDETGRCVAIIKLMNVQADAFGITFAPAAQAKLVNQTAARKIAELINRPDA